MGERMGLGERRLAGPADPSQAKVCVHNNRGSRQLTVSVQRTGSVNASFYEHLCCMMEAVRCGHPMQPLSSAGGPRVDRFGFACTGRGLQDAGHNRGSAAGQRVMGSCSDCMAAAAAGPRPVHHTAPCQQLLQQLHSYRRCQYSEAAVCWPIARNIVAAGVAPLHQLAHIQLVCSAAVEQLTLSAAVGCVIRTDRRAPTYSSTTTCLSLLECHCHCSPH